MDKRAQIAKEDMKVALKKMELEKKGGASPRKGGATPRKGGETPGKSGAGSPRKLGTETVGPLLPEDLDESGLSPKRRKELRQLYPNRKSLKDHSKVLEDSEIVVG